MLREEFRSRASGCDLPGRCLGSVLTYHHRVGMLRRRVRLGATGAFEPARLVHAIERRRAFEQNLLFQEHPGGRYRRAPSATGLAIRLNPRVPAHSSTVLVACLALGHDLGQEPGTALSLV